MKCIVCGKKDAVIEKMCLDCYMDRGNFINPPGSIVLGICPKCGSVRIGKHWNYEKGFDEAIREIIEKNTSLLRDNPQFDFKFSIYENSVIIDYLIKIMEKEKHEVYEIPLKIEKQTCPRCSRYLGDYFEAILQIRSEGEENEDINMAVEKTEDFIKTEMKKNPDLYILKKEKVQGGVDFYLSSNTSAKIVSKKLVDQYNATLKEAPQLAGVKDGEKFYRVTYSVRLPFYRIGDYVKSQAERYRVINIKNGMVKLVNLENGKIITINQRDFSNRNFTLFAKNGDERNAILIYRKERTMEIMDPVTLKIYDLRLPEFDVGDEIKIVYDNETPFIVPKIEVKK